MTGSPAGVEMRICCASFRDMAQSLRMAMGPYPKRIASRAMLAKRTRRYGLEILKRVQES